MRHPGIYFLRWSQRIIRATEAFLEGLMSGIFIGLMADKTLQFYDSAPYDEEKIRELPEAGIGLEPWENDAFAHYFDDRKRFLLVAAGGVREMLSLLNQNLDITAVDYSPNLVRVSNEVLEQEGFAPRIALLPRYECPEADRPFDAVVICRKFFSSLVCREQRIEFLRRLRSRMSSQSPLLVSFYIRTRKSPRFAIAWGVANFLRTLLGRPVIACGTHMNLENPNCHHHFSENEIREELLLAGFEVEHVRFTWFGYAIGRQSESLETTDSSDTSESFESAQSASDNASETDDALERFMALQAAELLGMSDRLAHGESVFGPRPGDAKEWLASRTETATQDQADPTSDVDSPPSLEPSTSKDPANEAANLRTTTGVTA